MCCMPEILHEDRMDGKPIEAQKARMQDLHGKWLHLNKSTILHLQHVWKNERTQEL